MIPEVRHALVSDILISGHWYSVIEGSYTQRGEMFSARLGNFPERKRGELPSGEVTGRLHDVQAWKFKAD